ncbi:MAG: hypothetical protein K2H40_13420, partial [Lachnospiraceae bacterium]|nr:hypothetical protein [Lachnospiraceae bacterium]
MMIYWYLAILVFYLLLFFLSRKEKISAYQSGDTKKSYPGESLFLKAAVWCIRQKTYLIGRLGRKRQRYQEQLRINRLGSHLKLLHPDLSEKYQLQAFYIRQYSR